MEIKVGKEAPDFTLFNTEKAQISLDSLKEKNVLILFFPLAFTSTCTVELCNIRDNLSWYQQVNANVIGISVDSLFSLKKYKEEQQINFNLLSDFNKDVCSDYGTLYDVFAYGMKAVSKRAAFIVDKKGIVQYAEILENASDLPNFEAIQTKLKEIE